MNYKIILEVEGTPVSTDKLLRELRESLWIKSKLRPLKKGETWQDVIYKTKDD